MSTALPATPTAQPLVTRTISTGAALTVIAVVFAGFAAARAGEPLAWLLTPLVAYLILRAALGSAQPSLPDVDARELPVMLQHRLYAAFDRLPEGEARSLLMEVLIQARPLYASR